MNYSKSKSTGKYHYIKGDRMGLKDLYYSSNRTNESLTAQLVTVITMGLLALSLIW
jgi:hypothetical protein